MEASRDTGHGWGQTGHGSGSNLRGAGRLGNATKVAEQLMARFDPLRLPDG
jgi:hypothetical protein